MADSAWMEVSLVVDGELAEPVAEVLARFAPNGVALESTQIIPDPEGQGTPGGPLRVCAYIPMDENLEETRRKIEESLFYLSRAWPENPLPAAQFAPMQEVNWVETWKQHYHPIAVGQRLMIVPAWVDTDTGGRIPLRMEPGMAFGTGTHPTTQLCLEAIEAILGDPDFRGRFGPAANDPQGIGVIDVGCGSGILSIAAIKLGAGRAVGVDIDPEAMPVAQQNAELNGVTDLLELGIGSVAELLKGDFSLRSAPLVLANILAPILVRLLGAGLADLVEPGGVLVLSGILEEQWQGDSAPLREAVKQQGLNIIDTRQQGDWVCVSVKVPLK